MTTRNSNLKLETFTAEIQEHKLAPSESLTFLAIMAGASSSNGVCAESAANLGKRCNIHKVTVQRALRRLEELDLIAIEKLNQTRNAIHVLAPKRWLT